MESGSQKLNCDNLIHIRDTKLLGTMMYVVEGSENGFTSIPQSIYWAIVTVTTVGFGDIVPRTVLCQFLSSIAMIMGYAIIATYRNYHR